MNPKDFIRTRSVCLKKVNPTGQAIKACSVLQGVKGVFKATPINAHRLKLTYSLEYLTFELIEALLKELGFQLDLSMPAYLRRYYYQYMEDNAREALIINEDEHNLSCTIDPQNSESDQYWDEYH